MTTCHATCRRTLLWSLSCIAMLSTVGCSSDLHTGEGTERRNPRAPGLAVTVQALEAMPDLDGFRIDVTACNAAPVATETAGLDRNVDPDDFGDLDLEPTATGEAPAVAEQYFGLEARCYQIDAMPVDAEDRPIETCSSAGRRVELAEGRLQNVVLVSECDGDDPQPEKNITFDNEPPEIRDPVYIPSRTVECTQTLEICTRAVDPEGDRMRTEWSLRSGPTPVTEPTVTETIRGEDWVRECLEFELGVGEWIVELKVWDRLELEGELVDFEKFYDRAGAPYKKSSDVAWFPVSSEGRCPSSDKTSDNGTAGRVVDPVRDQDEMIDDAPQTIAVPDGDVASGEDPSDSEETTGDTGSSGGESTSEDGDSGQAGPPDHAGPPEHAGPPDHAGPSGDGNESDRGNSNGSANGNSSSNGNGSANGRGSSGRGNSSP